MEKICIARLRRNTSYPGDPGETSGRENRTAQERPSSVATFEALEGGGGNGKSMEVAGKGVSLLLTQEQMETLRANRRLAPSLSAQHPGGVAALQRHDEAIVLKFEFDPMPPIRLLKVEEVLQMLRISKGSFGKIVRQGLLKSYKFGRLRRIMLADLLSYLEEHREQAAAGPRAPEDKPSASGFVQPSLIKEE